MFLFSSRRQADLNRRMEVLQTSALPLGYVAALTIINNNRFCSKLTSLVWGNFTLFVPILEMDDSITRKL